MDEFNDLILSKKTLIFYFYNEECYRTNKLFDKINKTVTNNNIILKKYDVENFKTNQLIKKLEISCYPCFLIYKDGQFLDKIIGVLDNIENILNLYINI
jgi:thiol-disulfide isomerase/thioredoxin